MPDDKTSPAMPRATPRDASRTTDATDARHTTSRASHATGATEGTEGTEATQATQATQAPAAMDIKKMHRDFIANVSHELRSPLTSVLGFIETLQSSPQLDETMRLRFLNIMHMEATRMSRLINDLLSLARVERTAHIAPTDTIFIIDVVNAVANAMASQAQKSGHSIEVSDDRRQKADASPRVHAISDELIQVFHNLVDNAMKYGSKDTAIKIIVGDGEAGDKKMIRIDVINQGQVIDADHIPHLTERFYRVDKARSRELGGTGLGLAIVKHILTRHRGYLTITSTPLDQNKNIGETKFSVYLPLALL